MTTRACLLFLIFQFVVSGCAIGPKSLPTYRLAYNASINESNNSELLFNIVRLRHNETALFTQVSAVTSSLEMGVNGEFGLTYGPDRENRFAVAGVNPVYSEKPTVTISPMQGQDFITRFISNVSLDRFLQLYYAGWQLEYLLKIAADIVGPLFNFNEQGADPLLLEQNLQFVQLAEMLGRIQARGDMEFKGLRKLEDGILLAPFQFRVEPQEGTKIAQWLELPDWQQPASAAHLTLAFHIDGEGAATKLADGSYKITLVTRNFMEILQFFGMFIELPAEYLDAIPGSSKLSLEENGEHFVILTDIERPSNAYVQVFYRDRWYYIPDNDLFSKRWFQFAWMVQALQSGERPTLTPLLTLPLQ